MRQVDGAPAVDDGIGGGESAGIGGADGKTAVTKDSLKAFFDVEGFSMLKDANKFFTSNRPDMSIKCHAAPCFVANEIALEVMMEAPQITDPKDVAMMLAKKTLGRVLAHITLEWHQVACAMRSASENNATRAQFFLHILGAVGPMKYLASGKDGAAPQALPYLPTTCMKVVGEFLATYGSLENGSVEFSKSPPVFIEPLIKDVVTDTKVGTLDWGAAALAWVGELFDVGLFIEHHQGDKYHTWPCLPKVLRT